MHLYIYIYSFCLHFFISTFFLRFDFSNSDSLNVHRCLNKYLCIYLFTHFQFISLYIYMSPHRYGTFPTDQRLRSLERQVGARYHQRQPGQRQHCKQHRLSRRSRQRRSLWLGEGASSQEAATGRRRRLLQQPLPYAAPRKPPRCLVHHAWAWAMLWWAWAICMVHHAYVAGWLSSQRVFPPDEARGQTSLSTGPRWRTSPFASTMGSRTWGAHNYRNYTGATSSPPLRK